MTKASTINNQEAPLRRSPHRQHHPTDGRRQAPDAGEYRDLEGIAASVLRAGVCLPHRFRRALLGASGIPLRQDELEARETKHLLRP